MTPLVLFVDDDEDIREAIGDLLEFSGYTVAHARDGLEALAWLRDHASPHAILLDLKMPRCDGFEFRRQQLADTRLALIPTLVLTADGVLEEGLRTTLGEVRLLRKPIDFDQLLRRLQP